MSAAEPVDFKTQQTTAEATHPRASAWVSANAGSGKTFVLSRRVIRLLLAGTDPARILCLTFTKAAAAEMAKRVFEILGEWATLPDAELSARIAEIEGHAPEADALPPARRLFAKALNTPGGLKIQTIHAFCERLLHQFPFEANVAGHFEVLDERDEQALKEESRRAVLATAYAHPDGNLGEALATVLPLVSDRMHEESLAKFIDERDAVYGWIASERAGSLDDAVAGLRVDLGLADDETSDALRAEIIAGNPLDAAALRRLFDLLMSGSTKDMGAAERLEPYLTSTDDAVKLDVWFDFLFTKDGPRKDVATKKTAAQWPGLDVMLAKEAERIAALRDRLRTADLYESTAAMLRLADAAFAEYDRLKRARGVLDFEDLVVCTAMLLSRVDAPGWVHYKLDRGVEHILVDEAQDTSPRQWQVIQNLASEFFAGDGASDAVRTLFAVGDEKQSIFSFQGAVPAWFSRVQRKIGDAARGGGYTWYDRELHLSFRSAPVVLEAVDAVFRAEAVHAGLTAEPRPPHHEARRRNDVGRVIVWPVMEPPKKPETSNWTDPVDHLGQESPEVQLARRLAATIRGWLRNGERLANGRPIRPGGILILSRSRGALTDAINRELKKNDVPIAGADRLTLTEHIAVMDLMAAGRVALLPEDDLSLAAVLKSPLIGLDEDALFALAHDRGNKTLWAVLVEKASADLLFAAAKQRIDRWRKEAEFRDPHAFFARILGPDQGRHALLQRLGAEAEDIIDEFLAQTLAYERTNVPSLQGFLDWLIAGETEVKRDTETLRDEVRVMTVHGAKGLEADVVFLVDNGMDPAPASHDLRVLPLDADPDPLDPGPVVWNRSISQMPGAIAERIRAERVRTEEEYRRLLYVGMTRARDRLYVVGIVKKPVKEEKDNRWHALVRRALEPEWQETKNERGEIEYEWRAPASVTPAEIVPASPLARLELPPWTGTNAPAAPRAALRLAPSSALAPVPVVRARREADTSLALERGRLVHRLLQSLPDVPVERRAEIGTRYLDSAADEWKPEDRARLLAEVMAVIADPAFAEAFAPGSRAEVEIAGRLGDRIVSGRIDRLAVTDRRVLIVDYKTNRPVPAEAPDAYVGQLAVYRAVLGRLYPGKAVAAALVWTDTAALMEIPEAALILAESRISAAGGHAESARQTAGTGPVA
ncbi:MAG: double-strand break repair helicase AddA [Bauldia sp.]